jgi:hypothetical protein
VTLAYNTVGRESADVHKRSQDELVGGAVGTQRPALSRASVERSSVE